MHLDTALFCFLSAAGLMTAMRDQFAYTRVIGIVLALWANLHLTATLAGFSVSVHNWLPVISAHFVAPGRLIQLTPQTAVAFFLFGCGLALCSADRSNQTLAVKAAIGAVLLALGCIVLLSLFDTNVGASAFTPHMAPLAGMCVCALGIALCCLCYLHRESISEERSPSTVAIAVIGCVLIFGGADVAAIVKARVTTLSQSNTEQFYSQIMLLQNITRGVYAAESANRGFLLTQNDRYLVDYLIAMESLRAWAADPLLATIPGGSALQQSLQVRTEQLDWSADLGRRGKYKEAVKLIANGVAADSTARIHRQAEYTIPVIEAQMISIRAEHRVMIENLTDVVLASYMAAILLVAVTVVLARLQAKEHQKHSLRSTLASAADFQPKNEPSRKRILLIEDNEDVATLVRHALQLHGEGQYQLIWAPCLKDGFRQLTTGATDLIVLDLDLPETSGSLSYACVRGCAPEIPVLVMTGDDSPETEQLLKTAGADGYVLKQTLSGSRLVAVIDGVLGNEHRPPQVNFNRFSAVV